MRKLFAMPGSCVVGRRRANRMSARCQASQPARACASLRPPMERLKHRYIVIEGPIGVGKPTLTRALCKRFRGRGLYEIVEEKPFLATFYQDRPKYALQSQLFFLRSRFKRSR